MASPLVRPPYKMEDYILTTLHLLGDSKYQVYPLIGIQLTAVGDVLLVRIETQSLFPILRVVFDFELLDVHTALYYEGLLLWDSPTHVFASNRFVDGHESLECWELCDLVYLPQGRMIVVGCVCLYNRRGSD